MFIYKKCPKNQYKYYGNVDVNSECRRAFFPIGDPLKNLNASISIINIQKGGKELKSLIESMRVKPVFKRGLYEKY
jgi:hypothetical protein